MLRITDRGLYCPAADLYIDPWLPVGKAQRVLAGMLGAEIGPIYTHGAVERLTRDYRDSNVALHATSAVAEQPKGVNYADSLIVAPPSAAGSPWIRRFGDASTAFASGWMLVRGARRRRSLDRGFVLSDHVDWGALISAIEATGAEQVWVTHGYREQVVRYLREKGLSAQSIASHWEGENDQEPAVANEESMA